VPVTTVRLLSHVLAWNKFRRLDERSENFGFCRFSRVVFFFFFLEVIMKKK